MYFLISISRAFMFILAYNNFEYLLNMLALKYMINRVGIRPLPPVYIDFLLLSERKDTWIGRVTRGAIYQNYPRRTRRGEKAPRGARATRSRKSVQKSIVSLSNLLGAGPGGPIETDFVTNNLLESTLRVEIRHSTCSARHGAAAKGG